ncbi:hypothetical protein PR001_g33896, partial [Phytophthora rubi]
NPKCISMGELYGEFNEATQKWHNGSTFAFQKLKNAVMKIKFSSWYKAKLTPTEVNTMLIAQGGKVDWAVATAYAVYFRNLKYGPYAIDMINKENNA